MFKYLLRLSGEISLKGSFRRRVEKLLERNILSVTKNDCSLEWIDRGRIMLRCSRDLRDVLSRVFGVVEIMEVENFSFNDLEDLSNRIRDLFCGEVSNKSFALRIHRVGSHDFTSLDVARVAGEKLRACGGRVDLENPDIEIYVEIRGREAYATTNSKRVRGVGGVPLGSQSRVLVLFSGGFDSSVATWLVMRKGSPVDLLYIHMGSLENIYRVAEVAEKIALEWSLGHRVRFYIADFSEVIREIREKIDPRYWQIALRRSMYILASKLVEKNKYSAIVTGESIWETNSQTIENLYACSRGLEDLMIIRPVIGMPKDDIISLSIRIGLYEKSEKVRETCWMGSYTPLKPDISEFLAQFSRINREVFDKVANEILEIDLYSNWREELRKIIDASRDVVIDTIPEKAVIADLTKRFVGKEYRGHKIIDLSEIEEYRDREIVFVCEEGELSELFAYNLRKAGFKTYSLRGGLKSLRMKDLRNKSRDK